MQKCLLRQEKRRGRSPPILGARQIQTVDDRMNLAWLEELPHGKCLCALLPAPSHPLVGGPD